MIYRLAFDLSQRWLLARRNRYLAGKFDPSSKIADLGSGNNPFKDAQVCIDKFDSDNVQRGGRPIKHLNGKELRNVDLNKYPYPFENKELDFVICSHLLEHLDDPLAACREISRIARSGYIEVPAFSSDIFMRPNDRIHKWLCLHDSSMGLLFFLDRRSFLKRAGPSLLPIWTRFFLSLKVTRLLWKGQIRAEYLSSESWR